MFFTDKRIARFWAKVARREEEDECWIWLGARTTKGYGLMCFSNQGKNHTLYAHRYAYILHKGAIPEGFFVLHECDNPSCVNPAHLSVGTAANNAEDRTLRLRHNPNRQTRFKRLSPQDLRDILTSTETSHALARKYNVAVSPIKKLRKGLTSTR